MFHVEQCSENRKEYKMTGKKRNAMGRGLDAIFDSNFEESKGGISVIRLTDISAGKTQPRKSFEDEALKELSESIKVHGVIQPVVVRSAGSGFYTLVAGERRCRAAELAGLTEIPAIIMEMTEGEAAEVALIENIQRVDLNPIEEAAAYKAIIENSGLTQQALSERLGKPRSGIANALRLLELPDGVQKLVADGDLSQGHAKVLMGIEDRSKIEQAAREVVKNRLSVRDTETFVRKINAPVKLTPPRDTNREAYIGSVEKRMLESLGRRVKINGGRKKTVEITYTDSDDLEQLIISLCGSEFFNE